jgi:hypothetical protein
MPTLKVCRRSWPFFEEEEVEEVAVVRAMDPALLPSRRQVEAAAMVSAVQQQPA